MLDACPCVLNNLIPFLEEARLGHYHDMAELKPFAKYAIIFGELSHCMRSVILGNRIQLVVRFK